MGIDRQGRTGRRLGAELMKRSTSPSVRSSRLRCVTSIALILSAASSQAGDATRGPADPAALEFFEKSVRPVLVERCQGCHGPAKQKGGLRLDSREAILAGGSTGPAIAPGKPESSLLVDAINYGELYQMPPKTKLPAGEIAILTRWVKEGATWGVNPGAKGGSSAASKSEKAPMVPLDTPGEFERRASYWSFQPLGNVSPPEVSGAQENWPRNPIDRFLLATLESRKLAPAPEADRRTLIRRV